MSRVGLATYLHRDRSRDVLLLDTDDLQHGLSYTGSRRTCDRLGCEHPILRLPYVWRDIPGWVAYCCSGSCVETIIKQFRWAYRGEVEVRRPN